MAASLDFDHPSSSMYGGGGGGGTGGTFVGDSHRRSVSEAGRASGGGGGGAAGDGGANTWGGVREGMIRVGDFGSRTPAAVRQEVIARQKDIASGALKPFKATKADLRDNTGRVVVAQGTELTDPQILEMNWLAEGVQGQLKH